MIAAWAGFAAGALHVVSGPDHLAALGPAASQAPSRAIRLGATWGLGHGAGVLVAALAARALGGLVGLEPLSAWAELAVGFVLVALGVRALVRAWRRDAAPTPHPRDAGGAFSIGVLHGAAGAHHLFWVLPALALESGEVVAYLVAYLLAAVLAMAAAGALVALGLRRRGARARRLAHAVAGAAALGVGLFWVGTAGAALV
ncbi:MAG TPA: hypothetical protein RMH99_08335 [Sandaracinaceae bacterium LLY-WYZ-13_1]|nr:hypothetical protein [Sandaracinaceae bacterium LLY-WYZ-13_1]